MQRSQSSGGEDGGAARGKKTMLSFFFFFEFIEKTKSVATRLSTHLGPFPFLAAAPNWSNYNNLSGKLGLGSVAVGAQQAGKRELFDLARRQPLEFLSFLLPQQLPLPVGLLLLRTSVFLLPSPSLRLAGAAVQGRAVDHLTESLRLAGGFVFVILLFGVDREDSHGVDELALAEEHASHQMFEEGRGRARLERPPSVRVEKKTKARLVST